MLEIKIPNNNFAERKYIIDIIFSDFLSVQYKITTGSKNYEILFENNNELIIIDHFFNKNRNELTYLNIKNLPKKIKFYKGDFVKDDDIVVLYGNNNIIKNINEIICDIDIFASAFFMLTRWEEYVNTNRDNHNRFPAYESIAFKNNFLQRPVVNEYIELLKKMLFYLDNNLVFKKYKYKLCLTHDVDIPLKYASFLTRIKVVAGDIIKRKNIALAFKNISEQLYILLGKETDPYNTFDYLMNISEKHNTKSYFFFMGKGMTSLDNFYKSNDKFIFNLIKKIKDKKHYIGIHPTYNAYNNNKQFKNEKDELEKNLDTKITFGREHFLRFEVPTTWQIWEDNNMKWDSTLGFADKEGFRAGICYEYTVFNILTRKKLNIKEKPLIVMDGNFVTYQSDISDFEIKEKIKNLINTVKKYNGTFVFLWHNSSFNDTKWNNFNKVYEEVLT